MTTRKKPLTPPLEVLEALHSRFEAQLASLGDHLQIMEVGNVYAHMMKSADYKKYCRLEIRCKNLENAIALARRQA